MEYFTDLKIFGHIALAMLLGALIGVERELTNRPAGVRTHMFIAGAAALLVFLGDFLVTEFVSRHPGGHIRADPIRIIEAIVTGVAFLGAGSIIRPGRRNNVQGLTTAAAMLFTAAVGICVAMSKIPLAVGVTLLTLVTLRLVNLAEARLKRRVEQPPKE